MTWPKTRAGSASVTTSVAMRRSAACSWARPRAATSLAARSAVTAASTIEVSAATARNSCVASRLSVSESRTNGPEPSEVCHTVRPAVTSKAVAPPQRPKRRADQISTGKTTYGTSRCDEMLVSRISATSSATPSTTSRRDGRRRAESHVSRAGVTTRAPARSESHQVRHMRRTLPAGRSPKIPIASMPQVAPRMVPAAAHRIRMITSLTRRPGVRAPSRRSSAAATTAAITVASVWPATTSNGAE